MAPRAANDLRLDPLTGLLAAFFLVTVTPLAADPGELSPVSYPLAALAGLGFVVRRPFPLATVAIAVATVSAFILVNEDGGPIFVAAFAALAWLGAARPQTRDWLPWTVASVLVLTAASVAGVGFSIHEAPLALLLVAAPKIAADRARARTLREAAVEQESARRLVEERLRIAREVHDVVGHGLATIALRAGVADRVMTKDPSEAQEALRAIRAVATESLDDLGALLGVLRSDPARNGDRAPVPGLDDVPRLVERMRAAGLDVGLEVDGDGDPVSDVAGTAAYRIVQEALTNVVRHAGPGARARVRLVRRGRGVEVEVADDGRGAPRGVREGGGLTGMRERATALGGRFEAGGAPGGGFRVTASLPAPR
ncbi:MAG TPA: sensor histidine kinase [Solirubrobacteraceae bacterium]|nr:sensor histidine kinase [Solirubrobacteraceae bacterium]